MAGEGCCDGIGPADPQQQRRPRRVLLMLMRSLAFGVFLPLAALAQNCAPAGALAPGGTVTSALDGNSCRLPDGTPYATYSLVLPARGQVAIDMPGGSGLSLRLRDARGSLLASASAITRNVERGSYQVMVVANSAGQTGSFSLRTAFTAEPGTMCRDFPTIGLNQTAAGVLGATGCLAPDGTPFNAYTLRTFGYGTLSVTVSTSDFTPFVTLRGDDGYAFASGASPLSSPVQGDSVFTILVAGDQSGAYQVTTAFTPADDETCRAQMSFSGPARHSGTINTQSCTETLNDQGDVSYFDYYDLNVSQAGTVTLTATSAAFDPVMRVLDASGAPVARDLLGGGKGQSLARLEMQPGTYTVVLASAQTSGGPYTLEYAFRPGPPDACPVQPLSPGAAAGGTLSAASCRTSFGSADLYSLTLPAAGTLDVDMTSADFDTVLALRDENDNLLTFNDNRALGLTDSHLTADLPAGSYRVVAAAASGSGAYSLTANLSAHDPAPCGPVQQVPPNTGYIQLLGAGPCRDGAGQPVDGYEFSLSADGTAALVMTSGQVDGFLTLTDPAGTFLRSDRDTYGPGDPLIVQFLPAGIYRLAASGAQNSSSGLYRVDVVFQPGPRPPGCAPSGTLIPGNAIHGTIAITGCQYPDDTFADLYSFAVSDTSIVDIELDAESFDANLVLLDAKGNLVGEDDGSGGSTARLVQWLDPGTYYVVAKPLADYASLGAYTLTWNTTQ